MGKPEYEEPYKWQEPQDTPAIKESIVKGNDEDNLYGQVIFSKGDLRIRESADLYAIYVGARLRATVHKDQSCQT